ncbi:uncharacterized protein [Physcomitrium patens]|uniref:Uncharacterized protein n=1 Tax=Physcomitrium patens TaxID=3218 RepID=A0A2K1KU30_PHYPA|nr:uncharacterized protein LOC112280247 [Physcomitrium patens]PNR57283.1 hypothetical protein PHYPA_004277 [Physcomitrium patens]|eukprot:XP_024371296.1 uncharacterized protein LOC112280247 [Physcomitrella patens]
MGVEKAPPPIISTLNPNASVFVPASLHVLSEKDGMPDDVVPPPTDDRIAPGPYSDEWWHLMETDSAFRHQYLSMCPNEQEKNILAEEFDVSADSDDFFSYQEKLALQEEEEELARKLAEIDYLEDEDLSLTTTNNCKDVKSPKQQLQVPWSKNSFQYQNKAVSYKAGGYTRKTNAYHRIHQPRTDM